MSDIIQVVVLPTGPDTFLAAGRHRVGALLASEKNIRELIHPGVHEEQGWVLSRNQGRTWDDGVTPVRKEIEESPANFGTLHSFCSLASYQLGFTDVHEGFQFPHE